MRKSLFVLTVTIIALYLFLSPVYAGKKSVWKKIPSKKLYSETYIITGAKRLILRNKKIAESCVIYVWKDGRGLEVASSARYRGENRHQTILVLISPNGSASLHTINLIRLECKGKT